jgi:hypothetical protein
MVNRNLVLTPPDDPRRPNRRARRAVGAKKWARVNVAAEPRSVYLLSGSARSEWEHSIPPVEALRYSVTFRNLREG